MNYGILSGKAIQKEVEEGGIVIDPYDPKYLNPASYDLTLGDEYKVYASVTRLEAGAYDDYLTIGSGRLDSKAPNTTRSWTMPSDGLCLKPGMGYLMHTVESVGTNKYVPIIDGKSSIGRLFCQIHATAGFGDPGFFGQYTLEVIVTHPVVVYPGMRIAQIRFHTIAGEVDPYHGNYTGEDAKGAIPSKSYKQFDR